MPIKFSCANCGQKGSAPDNAAGVRGKCPKCGEPVVVPTAASPRAPAHVEGVRGSTRVICFDCTYCFQEMTITSTPGATTRCPHCHQTVRVPSESKSPNVRRASPSVARSWACPECRGTIDADAKRCPHCRRNLRPWYQRATGWSLLAIAAVVIGLVLFWPEIKARVSKAIPIPPAELDATGKGVATKMIEHWKLGEPAGECWAPDADPSTLFAVRDYVFLKSMEGEEASRVWTVARMNDAEEKKDKDLLTTFDASERREIERRYLDEIGKIEKPAPGVYAAQRFRIQSSTKGGTPIEAMWDVILRKVGGVWKVVEVTKAQ